MTFAIDPTGGSFGVWQAGQHVGAQLVNERGALVWNELHTPDRVAANAFYSAVFGWTQEPFGDPAMGYDVQKVDGEMIGGVFQSDTDLGWQVYFAVADADATAAKAAELGGEVVSEPADMPYGRDTVLRDPHGVLFHALYMPTA
jgi:predicted enzyme related to lactoylglutathione lyase